MPTAVGSSSTPYLAIGGGRRCTQIGRLSLVERSGAIGERRHAQAAPIAFRSLERALPGKPSQQRHDKVLLVVAGVLCAATTVVLFCRSGLR